MMGALSILTAIFIIGFFGLTIPFCPAPIPGPVEHPGKVICPPLPNYDGRFGKRLDKEIDALPDDSALLVEHGDYMRLLYGLEKNCGGA